MEPFNDISEHETTNRRYEISPRDISFLSSLSIIHGFVAFFFFFNLFLVYATSANSSIFFPDKLFNYGVNFIDLDINAGCFDFVSFFSGISHTTESSGL